MSERDSLRHYLRCYDDNLDAALCAQLIGSFNALTRFQRGNGRGVRAGLDDSAWTELDISPLSDEAFRGFLMTRIDENVARYNRDVGLRIAVPPMRRISELVIKRYRPGAGERFQLHFDAIDAVANRYLVLLWYLNDVADGGETRFPDLRLDVQPRAGRLLMFPPYWMYQHEAPPPRSGEKYILSTYLLFQP
ncbi:MAG TPA: 2OG-Fe(II) oxygenase [Tahibacter sp.]|uniref:2OG-Fe(II) oxygenase n=1 Tax=Tahibacter sp. TaxID=2056211 RepID=UPI002C33D249|nr:2OG-Fe(II) oxygenase [Tahibacter sp.]HSX58769.1 2OG-Fe(II) oxygenase [Tahibacter sp.]